MMFFASLKRALLFNFLVASVLPLVVYALFIRFYVGDYLVEEVVRNNHFLVSEIRSDTEEFLTKPVATLQQVSRVFSEHDLLADADINAYLEKEVRKSGYFESIFLLDQQGRIANLGLDERLDTQKNDYLSIDLSAHELYSHPFAEKEVFWSDTFISIVTGKPSITIGLSVEGHILVGNVSLDSLNNIVSRFSTLADLNFAIIDRKGVLIAHSDHEKAMQRVNMMYHPEVVKVLEGETGVTLHTHEDGTMLESVVMVPQTGWAIWVGRDRNTVLSPIRTVQNFTLIVLLGSFVIAALQAILSSRKLMRPISGLVDGTTQMAEGKYQLDLPEKSYNEINTLAAGFQSMSRAVNERETSIAERESRFRNLVNSIEGVVWEYDLEKNVFLFVSRHCEAILGSHYQQWLDSPDFWKKHIHPDDRQWVSDYFDGLSLGRLMPQFEFRMLNQDGRQLWVRNMVNVVRDPNGTTRMYGVIIDITDRKNSEIALRNSEIRFRSLVEQAADAIVIHDQHGNIIEVNERACQSLGYSRDELVNLHVDDIDDTHDPAQYVSLWNTVRHGETITLESTHRRKDGSTFPVEIRLGSFTFEDRPLFLALVRDVTERRKADAALRESEERFRNYFELGLIGMSLRDRDGKFVQFNDRLCEIVGYEREEMRNKTWFDLTHPDDMEESIRDNEKLINGEIRRLSKEKRYIRKNGEVVYVSISALGIKNARGAVDYTIAVAEDITARKTTEKALKESEEQVRLLLNSTAEGIYGIDLEGNCTFCNPSAVKMLGYDSENDLLDRNMHMTIHHTTKSGEPIEQSDCLICRTMHDQDSIQTDEEIFWRADGTWFNTEYWAHPIEKNGELIGTVVTFHDVTERKLMQKQSIRTAQLASLGELAAGVAHEINNPINGVINYAQILINRLAKSGLETDLAARIMKEGERIAVIVRDLLFFAREGGPEVNKADVRNVLAESLSLTEAQIRKEGILLKTDFKENLPIIMTRAQQIQQLFLNILSNSRHALNEKFPLHDEGKVIEISAHSINKRGKEFVQVTFKDYGTGIPAAMLDKVMNPFVTTKPAGVGTGLGLSISHEIVGNHKGEIRITSQEGEWTEVTIELPAADRDGK